MKVLDLDLDFFLSDVPTWPQHGRPDSEHYVPWGKEEVKNFLEDQCGLSQDDPIPGRVVEKHDEVFKIWRSLIDSGNLDTCFEVFHVDSHADLGFGDGAYKTIVGDIVHRPVSDRADPPENGSTGLQPGNYLVFALACRWISKLVYVRNPEAGEDKHPIFFKDQDENSGVIKIPGYTQQSIEQASGFFWDESDPVHYEPEIPFIEIEGPDFDHNGNFDFFFLSESPQYTPPESDQLIDVVREYIQHE